MTQQTKMTSIEWIWEQIPFEFTSKRSAFEIFEQAKQMHKKELVRNANQLKISNKEIESAANEHNRNGYFISPYSFAEGAKWYRKKLKRK
jgi:hypothetical protein